MGNTRFNTYKNDLLFKIEVELPKGRKAHINVHRDSNPRTLALKFVTTWKLPLFIMDKLEKIIIKHIQLYKENNSFLT